jgi:hypothetical protein
MVTIAEIPEKEILINQHVVLLEHYVIVASFTCFLEAFICV